MLLSKEGDQCDSIHGLAGGEILMSGSIREAYEHGKGPITVRGKAFIEGTEEAEDGSSEASSSAGTKQKQTRKKVGRP